ncbi:membrane protein [Actinomycetes bacterium]|nr:membrane protein [Actinomycetes bacterium]
MVGRFWFPIICTFVAGSLASVQARMNGELSLLTGNGIEAATLSFGSGLIVVSILLIFVPSIRHGVAQIPGAIRSGELRPWQLLAGLIGGFFVAVQSVVVPMIGVAIFTVAVVAGQSANSLVVDRIGLGPAGKQPITIGRVVSAVLAVLAVTLAADDRFTGGSVAIAAVAIAVVAGLAVAVQQALNGRISVAAGSPLSATFYNFVFGTALLAAAFGVAWAITDTDPGALIGGPWWAYAGGVVGVVFIAVAAWTVPILGVLVFALVSIAGQLSGALLLDVAAPTASTNVGWHLVAGVVLAFIAVAMGASGRLRTRRSP